jgi:hypothetical protein
MSQLTIEHTAGQVGTSHSMVFQLPNTYSGIHTIALRIYRYFISHDPLDVLATNLSCRIGASPTQNLKVDRITCCHKEDTSC